MLDASRYAEYDTYIPTRYNGANSSPPNLKTDASWKPVGLNEVGQSERSHEPNSEAQVLDTEADWL